MKTPPSEMSGPAWKAGPSVVVLDAHKRGGEVPPGCGIAWMGAQHLETPPGVVSLGWGLSTLRLLWNSRRGWTLHHSCIRSQCRRCLGILIRRVASGNPGCANAISGKGAGLTPGLGSMPPRVRTMEGS